MLYDSKVVRKKEVFAILCFLAIISTYKNTSKVFKITKNNGEYTNAVFQLLKRDKEYADKDVYIYLNKEDQGWSQKNMLATELAGDMRCKKGGYIKWKTENDAYLILSKSNIEKINEKYKLINSYNNYLLIQKVD